MPARNKFAYSFEKADLRRHYDKFTCSFNAFGNSRYTEVTWPEINSTINPTANPTINATDFETSTSSSVAVTKGSTSPQS